jgi:hypothetical protein
MAANTKKRGRPPISGSGMVDRIAMRLQPEDAEQLAEVKAIFGGEPSLVRAALRIGLTVLELEPALLHAGLQSRPKRRATLKARLEGKA